MTTSLRTWFAASALALSALAAQAQTSDANAAAPHPAAAHAERIAQLKEKLNLSPNQQGAWEQYQSAMKPAERPNGPREVKPALTEKQKTQMHQRMQAEHQTREAATQAFYAQLTPTQQKIFDAEAPKPGPHREGKKHAE
ncbi:hypothetical protein E9531_12895 [Lampropedia puyangensis]|uniref:LTXXQ motif family protein n=1 Tax=Lampropedia puyangensis TaxID=1330072 RepID=A0A4S8EWN2_9BURK|nr:Spy/CpxP family protein refolding chaperone [Lampropedia puyangensis]THT99289.1 hypothetical protein E9531_12895 [Lampropedia puyangensis]